MQITKCSFHYLLHAAALVEDRVRVELAPLGLGPRQARILDALYRMGSASQIDLAREFGVTPASMSTMTARLVAAGYIDRRNDPDERRSNILRLTKSGESLLDAVNKAWAKADKLIEEAVGESDKAELARITKSLRDALGGHTPGDQGSKSFTLDMPSSKAQEES